MNEDDKIRSEKSCMEQNFTARGAVCSIQQGCCSKHFLIKNSLKRFILFSHVLKRFKTSFIRPGFKTFQNMF